MKLNFYTNCSLVRIPIKAGVKDYYFPTNVEWAKKKVDKILFACPRPNGYTNIIDPVDGQTPVYNLDDDLPNNMFVTLYNADNQEIFHNTSMVFIGSFGNAPVEVNAVLNLSLCRITLTTEPEEDRTMLLYVFYDTKTVEDGEFPRRSVGTYFSLQADQEITLRDMIHDYVHALPDKIKGIEIFSNGYAYLTLRDKDLKYQMVNVLSSLMPFRRDIMLITSVGNASLRKDLFLLNDLDIDFDNSYIRNANSREIFYYISFLY